MRCQAVDTGYGNCLFISTTLADPGALSDAIYDSILATKSAKSRHVMRFYPVLGSCKCDMGKLRELMLNVVSAAPLKGVSAFSYRVDITIRANSSITKAAILPVVTTVLTEMKPLATVKLIDSDYVILVNVIKHVVLVSVLRKFTEYKKYNIQQLTIVKDGVNDGDDVKKEPESEAKNDSGDDNDDDDYDDDSGDGVKDRKKKSTTDGAT